MQKSNQGIGQVSPVDKVRLRVSTMISSPRAQAERRASIWKAQGDSEEAWQQVLEELAETCLLYTSPSPRDRQKSRMPSSA